MSRTVGRSYLSPKLVLLAMDWPDGETRRDFLGFAIRRTPGFFDFQSRKHAASSWLPNRLGFDGPPEPGQPDFDSDVAPIQKFMWWDARLEGLKPGQKITYDISSVVGKPDHPILEDGSTTSLQVELPPHVEFGIGTWFNRAVMSSQSFARMVSGLHIEPGTLLSTEQALELRRWLANDMEGVVPAFIESGRALRGAIYHLTDGLWIIPALKEAMASKPIALVYDSHIDKGTGKNPNQGAIKSLTKVKFYGRDKTNIMHDKFLVAVEKAERDETKESSTSLTTGSANYTTEGLTSQANLIHTFDSPELARLYLARFNLIKNNPTLGMTAKAGTGWSKTVSVGDAGIRVFFAPEPGKPGETTSLAIEPIVRAVHGAKSSVVFCLFTPTDKDLRDACFAAGDAGKMMFGLVNEVAHQEPTSAPTPTGKIRADQLARLEIYHRSRKQKDVIGAEHFDAGRVPAGFDLEINLFPGEKSPPYPPVIIHHKLIVIDAETESPIIYVGSANMSGNSAFKNDENLLEITGSPRLARIYLAEFLRLYEHYRARAHFIDFKKKGSHVAATKLSLRGDRGWADAHYTAGTPEYKARLRLLNLE